MPRSSRPSERTENPLSVLLTVSVGLTAPRRGRFRRSAPDSLKKIGPPPLLGTGHLRNRQQPLGLMPISGVDAKDVSNGEVGPSELFPYQSLCSLSLGYLADRNSCA
jgi:hypothetical protein